jgi:hypothetical protein
MAFTGKALPPDEVALTLDNYLHTITTQKIR